MLGYEIEDMLEQFLLPQIVKLVTGEEVVAQVAILNEIVSLKNPVIFVPTARGAKAVPYPRFGDSATLRIEKRNTVFITPLNVSFISIYQDYLKEAENVEKEASPTT